MRLLEWNSEDNFIFDLTRDLIGDDEIPRYAILSHTWKDGEEVTFNEFRDGTGKSKKGYEKIQFCGQQAKCDGLRHFWVDTCCINKSDHVELQDAINSMFRWYRKAAVCYVFLSDVSIIKWEETFQGSRWFTRGWTLQELVAPRNVIFFSKEGKRLGDKRTLERQIHEITGIAIPALQGVPLDRFDAEQRFSWSENRRTTRKEDKAYSLLGIFGIFMPLLYGEGEDNAFKRLRREIDNSSKDELQRKVSDLSFEKKMDEVRLDTKTMSESDPKFRSMSTETLRSSIAHVYYDSLNERVDQQHQNESEVQSSDMSCRASVTIPSQSSTGRRQYERTFAPSFQFSLEPNHGANEVVRELLFQIQSHPIYQNESRSEPPLEIVNPKDCTQVGQQFRGSPEISKFDAFSHNHNTLGPQPFLQKLKIRDYQRASSSCEPGCICKCHAPRRFRVLPHNRLFGSLSLTISPASGNKSICTEISCSRRWTSVAKATYRFPYWFLARIVCFTVGLRPQGGFDASLRTPRVIPDNADVMRFAKVGDLEGVKSLVEQRLASPLDVNATWNVPLLSYAVQGHHTELCQFLLNEGADPCIENRSNISALDRAGYIVLAQEAEAQVETELRSIFSLYNDSVWFEEQQFTPIHKIIFQAVGRDLREELQLSTSTINQKDSKGRTPLFWASARGDEASVRTLLEFGANPNITDETGNSALLRSVRARSPRCIRPLLEHGADIRAKNTLGFSALHYAAYYKDDEAYLTPLLDAGFSIDEKDAYGWTPLAAAAEYDHIRSANVLLCRGANLEARDKDGWTPLVKAVNSNSHSVLKLLLERGANPRVTSFRNETLLHFAASKGDYETVEILAGATLQDLDINAKNEKGHRAADMMEVRTPRLPQVVVAFNSLIERLRSEKLRESPITKPLDHDVYWKCHADE